jgi:hypothetical protein
MSEDTRYGRNSKVAVLPPFVEHDKEAGAGRHISAMRNNPVNAYWSMRFDH